MKIGMLSPQAFAVAAETIPAFSAYVHYEDWLDAREGLRMGLALAGVEAELTPVSLTALLRWARLTGIEPDEAALDRLAALAHRRDGRSKLQRFKKELCDKDRMSNRALRAPDAMALHWEVELSRLKADGTDGRPDVG